MNVMKSGKLKILLMQKNRNAIRDNLEDVKYVSNLKIKYFRWGCKKEPKSALKPLHCL